jgi:hypothetical protein
MLHYLALLALPFSFGNGQALLGALVPMVLGDNMLLGGLAEIFVFVYLSKVIRNDKTWYCRGRRSVVFLMLQFIVPLVLGIILIAAISTEFSGGAGLSEVVRWSWFVVACVFSFALARTRPGVTRVTESC